MLLDFELAPIRPCKKNVQRFAAVRIEADISREGFIVDIKNRTLFIVSLVILSLSCFYLYRGITQYNLEIDRVIHREEEMINDVVDDIKKYSFVLYHARITQFVEENEAMRQAFAEQNRQRLYELVEPVYKKLHLENKYFHAMDFNLPDGTVFLRVQKPDYFGDNISGTRKIMAATHKVREQQAGYDIGKHGALYWVTEPIRYKGEYIGAVEFGIEAKQLEKAMEERLKTEVATVLKANQWQKAVFVKHGFKEYGNYILMAHGDSIYEQIPKGYIFSSKDTKLDINGKKYILHSCSTLLDNNGKLVGRILVFQDISEQIGKKTTFIYSAILLTVFLLAFSFVILYVTFGKLIDRLEKYASANQKAKDELQKAHDELEKRVDQRTVELAEANVGLQKEINERRLGQERIKEQQLFLSTIIEALTHPFYVIDAETYEIVLANEAACSLDKRHSYFGTKCFQMTHKRNERCSGEDHPCPLEKVKETKKPVMVEHIHTDKDGEPCSFEIYAYPVFDKQGKVSQIIEYNIDVTYRKNAEQEKKKMWSQLVHSQKMEAIGVLAGGVAHDFNNILTSILGYSELLARKIPGDDPRRRMAKDIYNAGERAVALTRQLLTFSRKQIVELKVVNLKEIIVDMAKMLSRLIGEDITLQLAHQETLGNVRADVSQVEQILMNLIVNARDAMPNGGHLIIETGEIFLDEEYTRLHDGVEAGSYAVLTVTDTGEGMSSEVCEKIFDPFFTTKELGKGTGLGLSTVYGIVKQHKGHVYVYSEPGKGTTFKIYLPIVAAPLDLNGYKKIQTMPKGTEVIMVVDDDSSIRRLVWDTLEPLGYQLFEADCGEEAVKLIADTDKHIDLVLSDVIMTGMNGRELGEILEKDCPDTKLILMSGYTDNVIVHHGVLDPGVIFINKPLLPIALANKIRAVLDGNE